MPKLVAISGYDAALPPAYQQGGPLSGGGCGCGGSPDGLGKAYPFTTTGIPGNPLPVTMNIDVPVEAMAQDALRASAKWSALWTVGTILGTVGLLYAFRKSFR